MKLFLLMFLFSFYASAHSVNSITDIPNSFYGNAGNLTDIYHVSMNFNTPTQTRVSKNSIGELIAHDVTGLISIGDERKLNIIKISIQKYLSRPKFFTIKVYTADQFVKSLLFELRIDQNNYFLTRNTLGTNLTKMFLKGKLD